MPRVTERRAQDVGFVQDLTYIVGVGPNPSLLTEVTSRDLTCEIPRHIPDIEGMPRFHRSIPHAKGDHEEIIMATDQL